MRTFGVIITIIIIFSAAYFGFTRLSKYSESINLLLVKLENEILDGNWKNAEGINQELKKFWKESQKKMALMIDHSDFHDLNISLTRLNTLVEQRNKEELLRELAIARKLAYQITEQAKLIPQNIF